MSNDFPLVSIIVDCRNEEKFIGKCLDLIFEQDYQKARKELGWQPKYNLEKGLKKTIKWAKEELIKE